ncbi:ankyrin-2b isoform X2 [Epinephelus moara]|uniref:ankyrin-2b isoform X2 n=1 Tax=Epinephelus moara TaxID=300413 RepID=UPI00214EE1A5|nr:ankyrin-2b isoform X2 [Epinephelus moara]
MSPQLLRSDSSQSGISVASQQALLPDSPVPQYFASGLFQVCHRSVSTNSVLSDLDLETDLNISFLFDDRPASPDSLTSLNTYRELSPDSPIPAFTPSLAESVVIAKLDQSSSLESISSDLECVSVSSLELFAMNRPPSVYSVDESRPLSPESPIPVFGQGLPEFAALARSSSPVSVCPDLEYGDVSLSQLSSEIRPPSPDSVVSGDDYRGDSPIPEFKTGLTESDSVIFDRSSSPESVVSDVEYTQASVDLSICEQGTSRVPAYRLVYDAELWKLISQIRDPHYVGKTVCSKTGVFEYAGTRIEYVLEDSDVKEGELEGGVKLDIADSSDANTLQVMQTKTEGKENPVSEYRSLSPGVLMTESVFFMLKELAVDATFRTNQLICQLHDPHYVGEASANRAKVFEYEETSEECVLFDSNAEDRGRTISSDSEAEYRSLSPKPLKLLSFLNSDLQETGNSVDEYRPLCPDSHVPQLSVSLPKSSVKHKRPPSSKPVSDAELEQFDVANLSTRLSSPESEGSLGKHGSLSPDSPVPNFRPELQSSPVLFDGYRTSSPESGASELQDSPEFFPSEFCIQDRSDSPNSVTSEINTRPLSPESVTEYRPVSPELLMITTELRSSPDSTSSLHEFRTLSPDSPLLQFRQHTESAMLVSGRRSSSPVSVMSDTEMDVLDMPFIEVQGRSFSHSENEFRALSPDSPIPEFRQPILHPIISTAEYRSPSPESVCYSDIKYEYGSFLSVSDDRRTPSLDSVASGDERQASSPDSPVPQFMARVVKCFPMFVGSRSVSPESDTSDVESRQSGVSDSDLRCLSPDSPLPQYTMSASTVFGVGYRSTSPGSVYSDADLETDLCIPWLFEERAVSPGSTASKDEFRPLSSDSPIPEFTQALQESTISHMDLRSSSPESQLSDFDEEIEFCFPVITEDRSSPESLASLNKYRRLSPDSPVPDFRQALLETYPEFNAYRSSSPELESSEIEYAPLISQMFDFEDRAQSRQSGVSGSDLGCLFPDSPLPQYTMSASTVFGVGYRSTSPGSVYSDADLETDLCIPWLFEERAVSPGSTASKDEFRPLSPDSPIPEFTQALQESTISHMDLRSSSPESQLSDFDEEIELCFPMITEDRSSPESLASLNKYRRLSPDSPVPDFRQALLETYPEFNVYRSSSPESESSEIEYAPLISKMFDFEDRAQSRQSGVSDSDLGCLSPDSPLPQYTMSASTVFGVGYRSTSPGSVYSDADLETDLCIPWLFEERAASPGSTTSKDEFRPLSSDSPIPEFTQALQESTISHMDLRSSSPESQLSDFDEEIELCFPVITEDRSSPESLASLNIYRRLSPDSPVPDFRQALLETYPEFNVYRSSSPESESSEIEYAPLISQIFDFEDRAQSRQSGVSDSDLGCLSPDSPLPQYTMSASTVFGVGYRSTSPGSVYSDADLETDLCIPWLFEERAVSPGSTASKDEFRPLSPDSPIPEFTQALQESTVLHMDLRSSSPESVWSDVEMESPCSTFLDNRPPSLESRASMGLSPDSPLPDFMQPMFGLSETICGCQSASPESTSSEMEYIVISLGSEVCENRPSSPGSGTSGDEYRALSPDSPIPEYRVAVHERVIVNVGYRSSSPESIESDTEYAWSEIFMTMNCGVEDRSDTPESIGSELQEGPPSVESIPEYKPLSPAVLMLLGNILSVSPESTQSLDEHKRLSLDSPLPFLPQNVLETTAAETHYGCSSPESILLDTEYGLTFSDIEATDMRPLAPQSERSDDECKPLPSESPVPDFTKTFVENVVTVRDISPTEFSGSDDLSKTLDLFCLEERSASPEPFESDKEELLLPPSLSILQLDVPMANEVPINRTDLSTATAPTSPEKVAVIVDDFIYGADLRKLISQVHDPQYAGETFSTKTGFMQFVGSTIKTSVLDDVQDNKVKDKNDAIATAPPSEGTHPYTSTGTDRADDGFVCTSSAVSESPPPVIEPVLTSRAATHRQAKYMFETPAHEVQTESDDGLGVVFISDDLRYSPESLIDYMPISTNSAMVIEARASSPESVTSVDECRPLSPDSPLPEFTMALPECVTFLRSASSSPETLASDIDYALSGNLESQFAECRLSPPESALSKNYNERERLLSSQSLSNYKLMLLESAMQMADKRASSPESMPEFNENRSLSPDSPIPQFTVSLEYTATHGSSSAESMGSDSECELMVTSSRDAETDRPSSRESISSISEFRRQLPDSPVPDFMRILSSYFMYPTYIDRSSSPVSFSSDSEFIALPIDCWIDDSPRPLSPQTVESEEELFCCEDTDRFVTKQEHLSHVTSPLLPGQSLPLPNKGPLAVSPSLIQTSETKPKKGHVSPDCQQMTDTYKWMQQGSEAENIITLHATVCEEDIQKDSLVKNILQVSAGELKNKTASQRAPPQTPEDTQFQTEPLSASAVTQDTNKIGAMFTHDKTMKSIPLKLPDQNSYTTHRTVTPVLPAPESTLCLRLDSSHGQSEWKLSPEKAQSSELFSPMSTQFLVPPDYEAVFSGHQTLRVSEFSQASLDDASPVSPVFSDSISSQVVTEATAKGESENAEDFQFSPDFNRVLSEFQKTVSEFDSEDPKVLPKELRKGSETPQHSDSDVEFFDCRQALSDFSEPEEVKLKHEIYHISEPPSPLPGSSPSVGFLKGSPQYTAQPFLQVEDYKRFSSGSECLSEFAYDSEGRTEGDLPVCEELPSRDQAGYYDDDDFLGREIAEELGCLSTDSSEEEVLTTRVVRRRVIIQADNLPDMPPQTVTEEKYTDEHGNMVVKKITRKVIRKYVSADGMETQEVTVEGSHQETVQIEEGDTVSRVVKRTVLHSEGDQKELTFSEPLALGAATASEFEVEPVQGRKVSKVVKTTVVRGERMEKQTGDPSLAVDLPSARQDFEKALSYAGGFGKMLLPHVVEKEIVRDDGSVVKRLDSSMGMCRNDHKENGVY